MFIGAMPPPIVLFGCPAAVARVGPRAVLGGFFSHRRRAAHLWPFDMLLSGAAILILALQARLEFTLERVRRFQARSSVNSKRRRVPN